jgi:DNA-binding NtrC family response regulator
MAGEHPVLIVEDEFLIADLLAEMITGMGMTVCGIADTADKAVALAQQHKPCLVLMDVRLKGRKDGVDAAMRIHDLVGAPVIFITGSREPATVARINADHPADLLFKPVSIRQLRGAVRRVLGLERNDIRPADDS